MNNLSLYTITNSFTVLMEQEEMTEEDDEVWNRLNEFEKLMGNYFIVPDYVVEYNKNGITIFLITH